MEGMERICISLPPEIVAALKEEMVRQDRPVSWLIRDCIKRQLPTLTEASR